MNRFQHDNIDPQPTNRERQSALSNKPLTGINRHMSKQRRANKQARNRANQLARRVSFWQREH